MSDLRDEMKAPVEPLLPIELKQKQSLLEITDDGERLLTVAQYLRENGVI